MYAQACIWKWTCRCIVCPHTAMRQLLWMYIYIYLVLEHLSHPVIHWNKISMAYTSNIPVMKWINSQVTHLYWPPCVQWLSVHQPRNNILCYLKQFLIPSLLFFIVNLFLEYKKLYQILCMYWSSNELIYWFLTCLPMPLHQNPCMLYIL